MNRCIFGIMMFNSKFLNYNFFIFNTITIIYLLTTCL